MNRSQRLITKEMYETIELTEKVARHYNCIMDYEIENFDGLNPTLKFKFKGEPENIKAIGDTVELNMIEKQLSTKFPKQKINFIEESEDDGRLKIRINVNKMSKFYYLAEAILCKLKIPFNIDEEKCGFLKGKDIVISLSGEPQQFNKFKTLAGSFIEGKPKKSNKFKM